MKTNSTMSGLPSPAPSTLRRRLRSARRRIIKLCGPFGVARFGIPIRLAPLDRDFGFKRGKPIDRHYIEHFLAQHSDVIQGRVLEIGDDKYTRRFGGDRVALRDVLHVEEGNPRATIIGDLAVGEGIPSDVFDCVILCQTLHLIYDFRAALVTLHRSLKPGGVALITVPGISQVATWNEWGRTWHWAFTVLSLQRSLEEVFEGGRVQVESHGNVLSATAFLYGLATEELARRELAFLDPDYPVIVAGRAQKRRP